MTLLSLSNCPWVRMKLDLEFIALLRHSRKEFNNLIAHQLTSETLSIVDQTIKCALLSHCSFSYQLISFNLPRMKHEEVAVNMLDAVRSSAWSKLNLLLMIVPTPIEKTETINAATVAWTWTRAMFPTTIWTISFADDMFPRFACVESRDASVMSRLPLSPSSAGTRMKSSGMCSKTSQCCGRFWKSFNFKTKIQNSFFFEVVNFQTQ